MYSPYLQTRGLSLQRTPSWNAVLGWKQYIQLAVGTARFLLTSQAQSYSADYTAVHLFAKWSQLKGPCTTVAFVRLLKALSVKPVLYSCIDWTQSQMWSWAFMLVHYSLVSTERHSSVWYGTVCFRMVPLDLACVSTASRSLTWWAVLCCRVVLHTLRALCRFFLQVKIGPISPA